MEIYISMEGGALEVGPTNGIGSYKVGRGKTIEEALGNFLISYQTELGISRIHFLNEEARRAELDRRERELAKR